mmetsp:Transcript_7574/g.8528  ORF Transcript_7574/g.8528 Transcript_7574/m.8528 type:complete len:142 (-) Transcript_7574:136-561(-)
MESSQTTVIKTDDAPKAVGPYAQGRTIAGNAHLVYTAGQLGMDPKTMKLVSDDVAEQAEQALKNLETVLVKGGSSLNDVIKVLIFLTDMGDFARINEVYARKFKEPYPARSCVAVKALPAGAKFEVEAIGYVDKPGFTPKL